MSEKCSLFEESLRRHNKNGTTSDENFDQSDQRYSHFVDSHQLHNKNDTTCAENFKRSDTTTPLLFRKEKQGGLS